MTMTTAVLFNIQKFCVHDGPGIRTTVFFKGCPLDCLWCHNPESQSFVPELLVDAEKCGACGWCQTHCPQGAATGSGQAAAPCTVCGICADSCPRGARALAGQEYHLPDLLAEIEKDMPFYDQSGGGVTLSGGEALCQIDFVAELVKNCAARGINVAIDTCGHVPFDHFTRVIDHTGLFLYDLKMTDPDRHRKFTGQDNSLILANLRRLRREGANVNLRLPLIAGLNDDPANLQATVALAKDLGIMTVNLLPYHDIGRGKYHKLRRKYVAAGLTAPPAEELSRICDLFAANGLDAKIGG